MLWKLLTLCLAGFGLWVLLRRAFAAPPEDPAKRPRITAQDLEACPRCGAYKSPHEECRSCLDRPAGGGRSSQTPPPPSGRA